MRSTGLVLATGAIAIANEAIFAPIARTESGALPTTGLDINWRIVPATAILALTLGGLEKVSEPFAVGLAGLGLLAILIVPIGNAPSPIDNVAKTIGVA